MRLKTIKMGNINELPEKQKEKIIEEYRDINISGDWYDYLLDDFVREMDKIGIDIQPSTITFDCYYNNIAFGFRLDNKLFIKNFDYTDVYNLIYRNPDMLSVYGKPNGRGNRIEIDYDDNMCDEDRTPEFELQEVLATKTWEEQIGAFVEFVEFIINQKSSELLKDLTDTYDEFQTDESIIQTLLDMEQEFEIEE